MEPLQIMRQNAVRNLASEPSGSFYIARQQSPSTEFSQHSSSPLLNNNHYHYHQHNHHHQQQQQQQYRHHYPHFDRDAETITKTLLSDKIVHSEAITKIHSRENLTNMDIAEPGFSPNLAETLPSGLDSPWTLLRQRADHQTVATPNTLGAGPGPVALEAVVAEHGADSPPSAVTDDRLRTEAKCPPDRQAAEVKVMSAARAEGSPGGLARASKGNQESCGPEHAQRGGHKRPGRCSDKEEEEEDTDVREAESADTSACDDGGKASQVASTLTWLTENYELSEGVCLPRCVLYLHYLDLCKRRGFKPAGAATFGKLIRQKFKNITTRRLGTRGQSKYHYYGIGIKESSVYYQSVYTGKGLTRFSGIKIKTEGSNRKYSLSSKTGTLLPDFPDASNFVLTSKDSADKMNTFLMMYHTHCQRVLDTIITANFEEIQNLFVHFWQGYPAHLEAVLKLEITGDVIAVCDSILYKVLLDVLLPHSIQDLPESLCSDVRAFLKILPCWLENSLEDLVPENIKAVKHSVLRNFLRSMKRHLSFIKMAQTARSQLVAVDVTNKAVNDLDLVDLQPISAQTCFALNERATLGISHSVFKVFKELKSLLRTQTPIDGFTEWIDGLVESCVYRSPRSQGAECKGRAGRFLMLWTMFGALIMKDLTLNNAKSFSFLHLVKLTLDEYVLLVMETQADRDRQAQIQAQLQARMTNTEEIHTTAKVRSNGKKAAAATKALKKRKPATGNDELRARENSGAKPLPDLPQTTGTTADSQPNRSARPLEFQGEELQHADSSLCPPSTESDTSTTSFTSSISRSSDNSASNNITLGSSYSSPQPIDALTVKPGLPTTTTTTAPNPLPTLSPIATNLQSAYERSAPYIPSFHFNAAYSDYVNHTYGQAPLSQPAYPTTVDPAPQQHHSFHHPMSYSSSPAPPPYWTSPNHATPFTSDLSYHHHHHHPHLSHAHRNLSAPYDIYKRDGLHQRHAADSSLDNCGLIARPTPSYEHSGRSAAMYYSRRSHDTFQLGPSLSGVSPYSTTFMHEPLHQIQTAPPLAPPSQSLHPQPLAGSHLSLQEPASSLFLHDEAFSPAVTSYTSRPMTAAAASGFSSYRKSYLPSSFV